MPCLYPKLTSVATRPAFGPALRELHERASKLVHGQVGRVEHTVGSTLDRSQPRPFLRNTFEHGPVRRERVRPPRLREPAHQRAVARFKENQDRSKCLPPTEISERAGKLCEEVRVPHVGDDRRRPWRAPFGGNVALDAIGEGAQERDR